MEPTGIEPVTSGLQSIRPIRRWVGVDAKDGDGGATDPTMSAKSRSVDAVSEASKRPLGGTAGERNLPGGAFVDVRWRTGAGSSQAVRTAIFPATKPNLPKKRRGRDSNPRQRKTP